MTRRYLVLVALVLVIFAAGVWLAGGVKADDTTVPTVERTFPATTVPATDPPPSETTTIRPSSPDTRLEKPHRPQSPTPTSAAHTPVSGPTPPTTAGGIFVAPDPPTYPAETTTTTTAVPVEPYARTTPVAASTPRFSGWDWAIIAALGMLAAASFGAAVALHRGVTFGRNLFRRFPHPR